MMYRSLFVLILSFQMALAPVVALAGPRCIKSELYTERDDSLMGDVGRGAEWTKNMASGIYQYATTAGAWEKYTIEDRITALKELRNFFLVEIGRNSIKLQSYLYCLSPPKKRMPRKIGLLNFKKAMFDAHTTCDAMIDKLIPVVEENLRIARKNLALIATSTSFWRAFGEGRIDNIYNQNSYVKMLIEPNIEHPFSRLPEIASLQSDESEEALLQRAKDVTDNQVLWMKEACTNQSNFNDIDVEDQKKFFTSIYRPEQDIDKKYKPAYFEAMSKMPVIGYLNDYLETGKDPMTRSLNIAILREGFVELEKINCSAVIDHFSKTKQDMEDMQELCEFPSGSTERVAAMNKFRENLGPAAHILEHVKKYELERPMKELEISVLKKMSRNLKGKELSNFLDRAKELKIMIPDTQPIKQLIDISTPEDEFEDLLPYAWFLPVIQRFVSYGKFKKYKNILLALNQQFMGKEIKHDLQVMGGFLVGITTCALIFKKLKIDRLVKSGNGIFKFFQKLGFREICSFSSSLAVDVYFLNLAIGRTDRTHQAFFSSSFAEGSLATMQQLEDDEFGLYLEKIFFGASFLLGSFEGFNMIKNFKKSGLRANPDKLWKKDIEVLDGWVTE